LRHGMGLARGEALPAQLVRDVEAPAHQARRGVRRRVAGAVGELGIVTPVAIRSTAKRWSTQESWETMPRRARS
jgi:hypothetical protein